MQAVILAAGKGTRLNPITQNRSKALLPILGKPITARVMEQVLASGLDEFILVSRPGDEEFQKYFTHLSKIEASIRIVHQLEPSGSAHALKCAAPFITGDFLLSACDNLTSPDHIRKLLHSWKSKTPLNGLLTIMPVEPDQFQNVGVVGMDGPWISQIVEKPTPAAAPSNLSCLPLYIFSIRILEFLNEIPISIRGEYEIQAPIQRLIDNYGYVKGIPISHRHTLTNPEDLISINRAYFELISSKHHLTFQHKGVNTQLIPPVYIEPGTQIGSNCEIGPYVFIENNCRIGNHAHIENSVILRGSFIDNHKKVINQVIF